MLVQCQVSKIHVTLKQQLPLDGIYVLDPKGTVAFRIVTHPGDAELACVADRIHRRVAKGH